MKIIIKRFAYIYSAVAVFLMGFLSSGYVLASAQLSIATFENSTGLSLPTADMYTINYYSDLLGQITESCSTETITQANGYTTVLKQQLGQKYLNLPQGKILDKTRSLHNRLMDAHSSLAGLDEDNYCVLKYVLYDMQDRLRNIHVDILEESGIVCEFENVGFLDPECARIGSQVAGYDIKTATLSEDIADLDQYKTQLGTVIDFQAGSQVQGLTTELQSIGDMSKEIMELTVYKVLSNLKSSGLIDQTDIQELNGKFLLNMEQSCGSFHGNYTIEEYTDHTGIHLSFEVLGLPLHVNICDNYFQLRDLTSYYEQIVLHELGHHFYFFKDRIGNEDFTNICRSNNESQSGACQKNDFVSAYAQSNPQEDYAEHFMNWYAQTILGSSPIIDQKSAHFQKFLK